MMAGIPKPTQLKVLEGNKGKRPLNKREPDAEYLDDLTPPAHLSEPAKKVWSVAAPMLRKSKVLTVLDVFSLEMLCNSVVDYRHAQEKARDSATAGSGISPWKQLQSMHFKQANAMLDKFGMNPRERSRLMVDPQLNLFDTPDAGSKENAYFTK